MTTSKMYESLKNGKSAYNQTDEGKEYDDEITRLKWKLIDLMRNNNWADEEVEYIKQLIFSARSDISTRKQIKSPWSKRKKKKR